MTNNAYRDDLEAAQARASDLEREVEGLRKRISELETGDRATIEARENARRLAAALEREREELRQQHRWEVDDAHWRQASREESKAARAANAELKTALAVNTPRRSPTTQEQLIGAVVVVIFVVVALIAQIVGH
jgi:hypothetical protein